MQTRIQFGEFEINPQVPVRVSIEKMLIKCRHQQTYQSLYPLLQLQAALKLFARPELRDLTMQVHRIMLSIYIKSSPTARAAIAGRFAQFFPKQPKIEKSLQLSETTYFTELGPCKLDVSYNAVNTSACEGSKIIYPWGTAFVPNETIKKVDHKPRPQQITNLGMGCELREYGFRQNGMKVYDLGWGKMYSNEDFTLYERKKNFTVTTSSHKSTAPNGASVGLGSCSIQ